MSLPDYLLEDDEREYFCEVCGKYVHTNARSSMCMDCRIDACDMYADEKISEGYFHKGRMRDDVC